MLGSNLFAYCDNSPVNKVDYSGTDGQSFELGNGWYYRIDPENTTTGTKRHIHIWKGKQKYIQNDDGSPHDKGKGEKGKIPKWLNNKLIEKTGWDYNGKRDSFFKKTSVEFWPEGAKYSFADGTTAFKPCTPYMPSRIYPDSYESIYFSSETTPSSATNSPMIFFLPIIGPITLPLFSFDFSWGWFPALTSY